MDTVSILRCDDYILSEVKAVIARSLENIGGIDKFIQNGTKVLLKPNLLMKKRPDESVTTHNIIVQAVAELAAEAGGVVTIADSPGGLYNPTVLRGLYRVCGIEAVAAETGAALNLETGHKLVDYPQGIHSAQNAHGKSFPIIDPILDADVIINLPKLKTHMMMFYSGAVKNMFGAIPGVYKAEYHFTTPEQDKFADMLLDLCACIKPTISIMDGIWGMEGQGPSSGIPRKFGVILASASPYALDAVATNILGITPDEALTVSRAEERGMCGAFDTIPLVGDDIAAFRINDLIKPPIGTPDFVKVFALTRPFAKQLNRMMSPKPKFDRKTCVGCGDCAACCPAHALYMKERKVVLEKKECISCFCCQELCPKKAIHVKRNWAMRIALRY